MSDADEVRQLEIATKLVLGPLSGVDTIAINAAGYAIVDILDETEVAETIRAVGELLQAVTRGDREQIEKGERWSKRSRALSQGEARKVLRGLSIDEMEAFAERWEYCLHEVIEWSLEQRDIHGGALVALNDQDEMAKITGGGR